MAMTVSAYRSVLLAGILPVVTAASIAAPAPTTPPTVATPGPAAPASADPLENLVKDSPFLPHAAAGGLGAGQSGPLELRGVVMERGAYVFSLFDLNSKESYWVGLNEPGFPVVARSYDRANDTLTVEQQGRTLTLTLAAARTLPANAAAGMPQPPGVPPLPTTPGGPAGNQPVPPPNGQAQPIAGIPATGITPDEAQRLQRIADEIRRRRAVGKAPIAPTNPPTKP
jgi:hypothetical protein